MFHSQVFDPEDSQKTLSNMIDSESLSRIRHLFELVIMIKAISLGYTIEIVSSLLEVEDKVPLIELISSLVKNLGKVKVYSLDYNLSF